MDHAETQANESAAPDGSNGKLQWQTPMLVEIDVERSTKGGSYSGSGGEAQQYISN